MSTEKNDYQYHLEDLLGEETEVPADLEELPEEPIELPLHLEDLPEYQFLLHKKSHEFIRETLPKVQKQNNCGPNKAIHILARSMGYKLTFLHEDTAIEQLHNVLDGLNLNFSSKSSLVSYLAIEQGMSFSFRHSDQKDGLVIDIPGLTGELKRARFAKKVQLKLEAGSHAYYFNPALSKRTPLNNKKIAQFIEQKVRAVLVTNWYGFDKVSLVYHRPSGIVDHFLQSILPQAEISCHYGEATLYTNDKAKREGKFTLNVKNAQIPPIWIHALEKDDQHVFLVTFFTNCTQFMEKITIIHTFIKKIILENAQLNRQLHRFVQVEVEQDQKSTKRHMIPFTIMIEPFYFSDYYYSKFRNVNNLFFSFPKEVNSQGVISDRVIVTNKDADKLTSLEYLLEHNKNYMQNWSIRLLRTSIEETLMISTERLRQFLGPIMDSTIDQLINQLDSVYEQHMREVEYYADLERKRQAQMIKRFSYVASILLALFTLLQGLQAVQWFLRNFPL